MSISISYIAVKGETKNNIWKALSLEPSQESLEPISGAQMKTGWYLIIDATLSILENEEALKSVSKNAEVITIGIVEGENFCTTGAWRFGEKIWTVEHDFGKGKDHLEVNGQPPKELQSIKATNQELLKSQTANWDCYFSIPVDLFEKLVGINYGRLYPPEYFESTDYLIQTDSRVDTDRLIFFGDDGKNWTIKYNPNEP